MRARLSLLLVVVGLVVPALTAVSASAAIPDRTDGLGGPGSSWHRTQGRVPRSPVTDDFTILGHVRLPGTSPDADVFFYDHGGAGKFAYVGTWSGPCSANGVKIVDVTDPANPTIAAFAVPGPGVSTEDMVVERIGARDILAVGVQVCGEGGRPGVALFDVTDPTRPTQLSFSHTPLFGVHELDLVVRPDGRALALLAVPFVEFGTTYFGSGHGGDFRIVEVTDPENPVKLASWGILADSTLPRFDGSGELASQFQGNGDFAASYDHSVRAADDGMTAYASFWDAGVLKFDISDPAAPVLFGRTTYGRFDEGNAHSLAVYEVGGERYLLQNDEDAGPLSAVIVTSSATGIEEFSGLDEPWMPTVLSESGPLTGSVFDAGDGCEATDFTGAAGKIALVDTVDPYYEGIVEGWDPPCRIGRQVNLASDAGVAAFLSNLVGPDSAWPFPFRTPGRAGSFPAVQISDVDGLAADVRAALPGGDVTITLNPDDADVRLPARVPGERRERCRRRRSARVRPGGLVRGPPARVGGAGTAARRLGDPQHRGERRSRLLCLVQQWHRGSGPRRSRRPGARRAVCAPRERCAVRHVRGRSLPDRVGSGHRPGYGHHLRERHAQRAVDRAAHWGRGSLALARPDSSAVSAASVTRSSRSRSARSASARSSRRTISTRSTQLRVDGQPRALCNEHCKRGGGLRKGGYRVRNGAAFRVRPCFEGPDPQGGGGGVSGPTEPKTSRGGRRLGSL